MQTFFKIAVHIPLQYTVYFQYDYMEKGGKTTVFLESLSLQTFQSNEKIPPQKVV